jgi:hypothetical protein
MSTGARVSHFLAETRDGERVGRARHALGPAGEGEVGVAHGERLDGRGDGLGARAAKAVDVHRRSRGRHARLDSRHAAEVHVARLGVDDMAENDLADLRALDAGSLQGGLRDMGGERGGRRAGEAAAEGADGGARAVEDHDVSLHEAALRLSRGRRLARRCGGRKPALRQMAFKLGAFVYSSLGIG